MTTTTTIDRNSTVNQEIKGRLVQRDVFCRANVLMDDILQGDKGMEHWEMVENLYRDVCDNCGSTNIDDDICMDCGEDDIRLGGEAQDILEWWIVDSGLARQLLEHGEAVYHNGDNYIWGRTTSGQAILLDGVISDIAEEMEILEGQANSWADTK